MDLQYEIVLGGEASGAMLNVTFSGADAPLLVQRNAELLLSLESVAVGILRLEPEEHDRISFDAQGYKAERAERLRRMAAIGVASVQSTGRPYAFPPMTSRERRMLHLQLAESSLRTASSGDAARRFVVVYPAGEVESALPQKDSGDRARVIRSAFRPR